MPNRIDEANTGYMIPGLEIGPPVMTEVEDSEDSFHDAPYSRLPQTVEAPSLRGLQELFGLNQTAQEPGHMDPPPKPLARRGGSSGEAASFTSLRLTPSTSSGGSSSTYDSDKVARMVGTFDSYEKAAVLIRARASENGAQW